MRRFLFFACSLMAAYLHAQSMPHHAMISGIWTDCATLEQRLLVDLGNDEGGPKLRLAYADRRDAENQVHSLGLEIQPVSYLRTALGPLDRSGLMESLRNPGGKSVALYATETLFAARIDPRAAVEAEAAVALSIGDIDRKGLDYSIASAASPEGWALGVAGLALRFADDRSFFRTEALASRRVIPERTAETWFADTPPLPRRVSRLVGLAASAEWVGLSVFADTALSHTDFEGWGSFSRAGADYRRGPWYLAAGWDAATPGFIDLRGEPCSAMNRVSAQGTRYIEGGGAISLHFYAILPKNTGENQVFSGTIAWTHPRSATEKPFRVTALRVEAEHRPDTGVFDIAVHPRVRVYSCTVDSVFSADSIGRIEGPSFRLGTRVDAPLVRGRIGANINVKAEIRVDPEASPEYTASLRANVGKADWRAAATIEYDGMVGNKSEASILEKLRCSLSWSIVERTGSAPRDVK